MSSYTPWTADEDALLSDMLEGPVRSARLRELAAQLPGRSAEAIKHRIERMRNRVLAHRRALAVRQQLDAEADLASAAVALARQTVRRRCVSCGQMHDTTRYMFRCRDCRASGALRNDAVEPEFHGRVR